MHEQVYLRSGRGWMLSRHKRELQGAWIAFANRYGDGSSEFGSACIGTRGWRFAAVIRSDGAHLLVDNLEWAVSSDGKTFDVGLGLGGHGTWRWRPPSEGGGRVPLPGPRETTPLWAEGCSSATGMIGSWCLPTPGRRCIPITSIPQMDLEAVRASPRSTNAMGCSLQRSTPPRAPRGNQTPFGPYDHRGYHVAPKKMSVNSSDAICRGYSWITENIHDEQPNPVCIKHNSADSWSPDMVPGPRCSAT